jgi:predicted RNase H-like HicB family nuclease
MQYNYTVIVEKSDNNYGAWAPDLPGCVTTGATVEETLVNMREAIELHLEGMREDGDPIPEPSATAAVVEVAA